jgi:GDPmannose 4,6-dehydratase
VEVPPMNKTAGRRALITGITGQDGSYLAELLLDKGYEVFGVIRRSSSFNTARIDHIYQDPHESGLRLHLVFGDLNDASSLNRILRSVRPDEIYNLGAQSHVRVSFDIPEYTAEVTAVGAVRLLEAIRETGLEPRFYQASSSELFGAAAESPQTESTPFRPRSPYAAAKAYAYYITQVYREAWDWGFAGEYVDAMWRMLQTNAPEDYVIATGETHSVREFLEAAFGCLDLDWREHVETDPRYLRPAEVDALMGDASKARRQLGWEPRVKFPQLVQMMVDADLGLAQAELNRSPAGA